MKRKCLTELYFLVVIVTGATACSLPQTQPIEILGLHIGMEKSAAQSRLNEISEFIRNEGKNQEIWKVRNSSRFAEVAVGYNDDKVRYVTAFVDKAQAKEFIPFSGVGDLRSAKAEIMEPHHRYIWDVPPTAGRDAYTVNVYGDNPEFVTIFTLAAKPEGGEAAENEGDED